MKRGKAAVCIALSLLLMAQGGLGLSAFAAQETADYVIVSPYEDVVWEGENAWGAYKGSLHSHSTYSDADDTLAVMVKEAYRQDYDFLAVADHGITGVDWNAHPKLHPLYLYQLIIDNPFEHLSDAEYEAIQNGTYDNRGKKMTPVLGANEFNNLSLTKNHVNGYFLPADKGNGFIGAENEWGYEEALAYIDENGGLSHINHPGDWIDSNANPDAVNDPYHIALFGDLILKYDSCLGIEVLNERNGTTGYDRILWDNLLMYCLPYGKTVIGFSNTDAHHIGTVDSSYSVFMMEENTVENIKETMQSGAFFGVTRCLRANDTIGPAEDFNVMNTDLPYPMFTSLTVEGHSIIVSARDSHTVQFIANGKVIYKTEIGSEPVTLNLDQIAGAEEFQYVRMELFGEGGLCLSQALIIDDGSEALTFEEKEVEPLQQLWLQFKGTKLYTIFSELIKLIQEQLA